jgi:hypothetical protein
MTRFEMEIRIFFSVLWEISREWIFNFDFFALRNHQVMDSIDFSVKDEAIKQIQHYSLVNIATLPLAYDTTCIYAINIIIVFDRFVIILMCGLLLIAV